MYLLCAVATTWIACGDLARHVGPPSGAYVHAPLECGKNTKFLYVLAEANGQRYWFQIDTGASATVIKKSLAARLGLAKGTAARATGVGNTYAEASITELRELRVGRLRATGLRVGVLSLDSMFRGDSSDIDTRGLEIAGVLGTDFLTDHQAVIDYGRMTLRLHDWRLHSRLLVNGQWRIAAVSVKKAELPRSPQWDRVEVRGVNGEIRVSASDTRTTFTLGKMLMLSEAPYAAIGVTVGQCEAPKGGTVYGQFSVSEQGVGIDLTMDTARKIGIELPADHRGTDLVLVKLSRLK